MQIFTLIYIHYKRYSVPFLSDFNVIFVKNDQIV